MRAYSHWLIAFGILVSCRSLFGAEPTAPADGDTTSWLDILGCAVDILNFAVVVLLLVWNATDRRSESRRNAKTYWIEQVVFAERLAKVDEFFMTAITTVSDPQANFLEVATQQLETFKESLRKVRDQFVEPLTWLHDDFALLYPALRRVEDIVGLHLAAPTLSEDELAEARAEINMLTESPALECRRLRASFFKQLLSAQAKVTDFKVDAGERF